MTNLQEITKQKFGDHAQGLLDAHAIIPLIDQKNPKAGIKNWDHGYDPERPVNFHSLAVLTGARSGITVWDIDSSDLTPPVDPNVQTVKGSHVYTPHAGEARKIKVIDGLDLLGDNGYAIFYGPGKSFLHPDLADLEVMNDWVKSLQQNASIPPCRDDEQGYEAGLKSRVIEQGYCEFLETQGYVLDKEAVRNQYVKTLPGVPEGTRNQTLYRYTREMVRCGLDLADLQEAAIESGLDSYEVRATMQSAEAAVLMAPGISVYDHVIFWLDNAFGIAPKVAHLVLEEVARCAIETNDHSPFIPQQVIADRLAARGIEKERSTVSKILTLLESEYGLIKIISHGMKPGGMQRNPNSYRLCIDGKPVAEVYL